MGLVTCQEMRDLEEAAFREGVSAEELMNKAGRRLGEVLRRLYPRPGMAVAYIGRGNNGGDALVALQVLRRAGWAIAVRCPFAEPELGVLPRRKLRELDEVNLQAEAFSAEQGRRPLLLIDGLFGIGARGPIRDPLGALAAEINALRSRCGASVASVDIPSGLDGDSGEPYEGAVQADVTVTIAAPKNGLLADGATAYVGRLEVVPLSELPPPAEGDRVVTGSVLRGAFPPRSFDAHKGQFGRVGIVAGSKGMLGAAILTATGALRGGAGLTTLFVLEQDYPLFLAAGPPPELMVKPVAHYRAVLDESLGALAVGPGLGQPEGDERAALFDLMFDFEGPAVLDADALNMIARDGAQDRLQERMILTPHPGEMKRLFPRADELSRAETARQFVAAYPATLLYKGARTIVTAPGEPLFFNSTGTPGMATGGQGDVLTGLLGALLAAGHSPLEAARAGAWLAGRASEMAVSYGCQSEESLLAGDTARSLGPAFASLREGGVFGF